MPTKKRRVGFIPRNDVLDIINKLSYENNLSYSKIINILVEEALNTRGLIDNLGEEQNHENINRKIKNKNHEKKLNLSDEFNNNFKNNLIKENSNFNEVNEETLDREIYAKFLLFLQFQEKMKRDI